MWPALTASLFFISISEIAQADNKGIDSSELVDPEWSEMAGGGDGVYGRLDGDISWEAGVGAALLKDQVLAEIELALLYYSSVGLRGGYADSFNNSENALVRSAWVSLEMQPLFLSRWFLDMSTGNQFTDLLIDSLALDVGMAWEQVNPLNFGETRALLLGASFGIPLFGRATGLWLRAGAQYRLYDTPVSSDAGMLQLNLCWRGFFTSPFVSSPP